MSKDDALDFELIIAARRGDRRAFEQLYHRYRRMVAGIVWKKMRKHPELARDAVQEVWAHIFVQLPRLRDGRGVRGWIAVVATRYVLSLLRRPKYEVLADDGDERVLDPPHDPQTDETIDLLRRCRRLRACLDTINPRYAGYLRLYYLMELSAAEIQETLGVTASVVLQVLVRARAALKRCMNEHA